MSDSPSARPVVLIVTCLLSSLVGIFIGTRIAGGDSAMAGGSGEGAVSATAVFERGDDSALEQIRSTGMEPSEDLQTAVALSPESVELDAFLKFGQIDPLGAAQEALAEANNLERISKLALLLSGAGSEDMAGIADLISSNRNHFERMQEMSMLYYAWGRVDAQQGSCHYLCG